MIFLILGIFILIIFLFLIYVAYRFITPKRLVEKWTPKDFGYEYENFTVETHDGIDIRGWHIKGGEECVLLLHGYGRSRWDDVYMKKLISELPKNGCSLITFDFRAHGKSGGKHTTLGYLEMMELESVYKWAKKRCKKIYIIGFSMGGNIALRAAARGVGDKIIADSPFVDINATAKRAMRYFAGLPGFVYYFVKPLVMVFQRGDYNKLNLMNYAKKIKVPVLVIAGKNDKLVSIDEIQKFFKILKMSNPRASLWITDGEHVRTVLWNENLYLKRIVEFIRR